MEKKIVLIASYPFAVNSIEPLNLLKKKFHILNPAAEKKEKLSRSELLNYIREVDAVIAGTEKYDAEILSNASKLKIISRLGIGLDNIDFSETKKRNITVAYTPDAPSQAVAELTIGFIITGVRKIVIADKKIREDKWTRLTGKDIQGLKIGIIGLGRIGKRIAVQLKNMGAEIYANDIKPDEDFIKNHGIKKSSKKEIYTKCDVITLHIPLTDKTKNLITKRELNMMKRDAVLINTSRGKIVNEKDFYIHLKNNNDFYGCLDVYENEPYSGNLTQLSNVLLTAHMGSCSVKSRYQMEMGAVENILNFFETGCPKFKAN